MMRFGYLNLLQLPQPVAEKTMIAVAVVVLAADASQQSSPISPNATSVARPAGVFGSIASIAPLICGRILSNLSANDKKRNKSETRHEI
jgi:hypothetical protein